MDAIASQITSLTIVYSTVYSDADQRKHQSSASLAFVWGIHRGPVNSPHKWPVTRKMFPFDDVIMKRFRVMTSRCEIMQRRDRRALKHPFRDFLDVMKWCKSCQLKHASNIWAVHLNERVARVHDNSMPEDPNFLSNRTTSHVLKWQMMENGPSFTAYHLEPSIKARLSWIELQSLPLCVSPCVRACWFILRKHKDIFIFVLFAKLKWRG